MKAILVVGALLVSFAGRANEVPKYGFTEEENQAMARANAVRAYLAQPGTTLFSDDSPLSFQLIDETDVRAYAEYDKAGYLIFSHNFAFDSKKAKQTMAENLPKDVQLVVYTGSKSAKAAKEVRANFEGFIEKERLTVVYIPGASDGFWARDGVPVPVIRTPKVGNKDELFTVVDAVYLRFEQDRKFSHLFFSEMTAHDFYFEGGNFITNSINECLVVNKTATAQIPDRIFEDHYGCKKLTRLPHVRGIGHADEVVKFIDDKTVLTDEKSYAKTLENEGYTVIRLPRADRKYETYVNSLLVNGTVYVPIFNEQSDKKALDVYRNAGFDKVIGINSEALSNEGLGSLHCITMTYPPVEMNKLLEAMGGAILE